MLSRITSTSSFKGQDEEEEAEGDGEKQSVEGGVPFQSGESQHHVMN